MSQVQNPQPQNVEFFNTIQEEAHNNGVDDGNSETISREEFIEGAAAMGVDRTTAEEIFDTNLAWVNQHGGGDGNDTLSLSELDSTDIHNQTQGKTLAAMATRAFSFTPSFDAMLQKLEQEGGTKPE